jgi:hypothetical protein
VSKNRTQKLRDRKRRMSNRKRRIAHRLRERHWEEQARPMFTGTNIHWIIPSTGVGMGRGGDTARVAATLLSRLHRLPCTLTKRHAVLKLVASA